MKDTDSKSFYERKLLTINLFMKDTDSKSFYERKLLTINLFMKDTDSKSFWKTLKSFLISWYQFKNYTCRNSEND